MKKFKNLVIIALLATALTSCGSDPLSSSIGSDIGGSTIGSSISGTSTNPQPSTQPSTNPPTTHPDSTPSTSTKPSTSTTPPSVCGNNGGTLLSTVGSSTVGEKFEGQVLVTGRKGYDFYIEDQSGAGFIYMNKAATYDSIKVGDRIDVSGTIASYASAGIYQITAPTLSKLAGNCQISDPVHVSKYSELAANHMKRVAMDDLSITELKINPGSGSDSSLTVTGADKVGFTIFVHKSVTEKANIDAILGELSVGDSISINGGFADRYKNDQIAITDPSQIKAPELTFERKVELIQKGIEAAIPSTVRKSITLPTTSDYSSTITWTSSNPSLISNSGAVTRPTDSDKDVTLSYVVSIGTSSAPAKSITVTVKQYTEGESDYEYIYVDPSYEGNYYNSVEEDLRGNTLLLALDDLLDSTEAHHSDFTYKNLWNVFKYTDTSPTNSNLYYSFYTGDLLQKSEMNREHVWPNSRGGGAVEDDPHMIRPANTQDNSGRGNAFYNEGSSYDPGSLGNNDYRGIAARIIFYAAVKGQESGLNLVDLTTDSTSNKSMGKLSTLLKWNLEYDIDATELQRNDVLFDRYNHCRNPFIDDRNYACKIWGEYNDNTRRVCSGS